MATDKEVQEEIDKLKSLLPSSPDDGVIGATAYYELISVMYPDAQDSRVTQVLFDELRKRNIPNSKVDEIISSISTEMAKDKFIKLQESSNKLVQAIKKKKTNTVLKTILWIVAIAVVVYLIYKFVFKGKLQVA